MSLINCEINLALTCSENCVITSKATKDPDTNADRGIPTRSFTTNATFKIKDSKLYVLVVTLSTQDDNKSLEELKSGFKRTIKWNNTDQK